jgi:hypothetical protein
MVTIGVMTDVMSIHPPTRRAPDRLAVLAPVGPIGRST